MSRSNPLCGAPRIPGELLKLGLCVAQRTVAKYTAYSKPNSRHRCRTHLSLDKDAPEPRRIQPPEEGKIVALPEVGGLYHRYQRQAA
jgi:hypothetical protein